MAEEEVQQQMEGDEESVPVMVDRSKLTPNMRHYLSMSKLHSQNEYTKGNSDIQSKNELTKTFCEQAEYQINKKVHEATVDRNYTQGKAAAVESHKGHQNLGYDNPQLAHHAKNAEMLSDAFYKEKYEADKDIVYFPVDTAPTYQSNKRVKTATDDKNYKADYEEMKKSNQLNLCETPVYKTQQDIKSKVSNAAYTKNYEETKTNVHPTPVTHDMILSKKQQDILTKDAYTKEGLGAIRSYNNDAGMLNRGDIQQAMKTQKLDDHLKLEYKKEYEENKTKYEFEKALNDVPLIKTQIQASKQADPTNTTYGASGKKAMERNEFTKTFCDTSVYKTNKKITEITRDSIYQKQRQEAIDQFKGFQQMDIMQVGSFVQHAANAENQSDNYYKEDWENDKDLVYFPANMTPTYEEQKKLKAVKDNYAKEAAEEGQTHHFNLAESETYKLNKDVKAATCDREYTKKWQEQKVQVKPAAITPQMELIEKNKVTKDAAYTAEWNKDKLSIHYPPDNPAMLNAKKAAKQSSDLHYKKDYNENVLGAKSHMTADGDLDYVVAKNVQNICGPNYTKDAEKAMGEHGFAPEFVQTEAYKINKNITEITSDRYNHAARKDMITYKGYQTMDPAHNPSIQHHAKNADQLNPYIYKEDYEWEKHNFYFPQHATEQYVNQKKLQEKVGTKEYVEDYNKVKKSNQLNLAETPKYITDHEVEKFRSDKKYKEKYDTEVKGHCIGFTTTPHMETIKNVKPFQNDSSYQAAAREAMKKNHLGEDNPELELSKKRQEIRSDVHYKKDYRENVQGHNIPCPVDCHQDYKTQAEVKAKTNDKAYKAKWEEEKLSNSITKEYCNTEQYKAQQKVKQCQSQANYTDFPKTRDEFKGFQQLEITTIPSFMMHARNADQLSEAVYKEDWNIDKECVYYPVQVTEKYAEDKKLSKNMREYKKDYETSKANVNFNQAETEKYIQDRKMTFDTSDAQGYKKDYKENVQGTMKGTAVTMEMENLEKLKITKDAAYTADAKERMKKYDRSLQDPDLETMGKAQVQRSDRDYKKDYNENVLGHNIGAPIEGHLDYYAQKQVKEKTADAAYKKDANENMRNYTLEPNAPVLRNNIEIQKTVNHALYTQSGKDAINEFKGFQQLDVFKNPYMNRHIINSENLSDAMYREQYEIDKDCIYYPYNTSEKYSQDKKMHETVGDLAYSADHKEEDWKHRFDLCTSEKYLQDQAGQAFKGQGYVSKHNEDKEAGKLGGKLVHTWEIDAKNVLQPLRDRVYKQSASELQRKYHLMMDDLKLEHLMKVQNVQNDRLYKKLYDEETKGKGAADPGIAYPWIKDQKTLVRAMRRKNYEADARKRMETVHFDVWEEQNRARVIALAAKDSEYRKSRDNAIATMKGFQTMPAQDHPDVVRGNRAADLNSHWLYINDWEEEKDLVFYPVQESEKYIEDKKLEEKRLTYADDSKEIQSKVRFNLCETEKYANDLKHENTRSDKKYQANYKENSHKNISVDVSMEMERLKPLKAYTPVNYVKEAKDLAMKYGLTADDNKLAASILSGKITSDLLYKKHYRENVQGKPANNPGIAYEMSTEMAKRNTNQLSNTVYQKEGRKAMEHNEYTKQQYTEMVKARVVALQCNDAEYKKGKEQAVEEFKGYMKMDASLHPIVTRGIQVSEMLSDALYKEDWNMEKDLIYYPVNVTPMYETMKNNKLFQSDLHYREKYHEEKHQNKFNQCDTSKYADDHKIGEIQSDAHYRKEWNETQRHQFKTPAVTMEMERVTPLKKLTSGVYAREAKNLAMKYGLVYDDITLTNLIAVGSLASDKYYKKKYNAEDLGKSSTADFNGYLPYVTQKEVKEKTCDVNYSKAAKEANMHNKFVQWEEELRAKKMALSVKDSEYKKSMWDAIKDMKGFMRMDASMHPVVTRGIQVAEMQSQALYTEEWNIEKDAIYFPVQITPGYETATNANKIQSDLYYKKDHEETKMKNKFEQTVTEKYNNDRALDKNVRSDKGYHAAHEESKFKYTSIPVTSEMERASIQRDLRDANYSRTAKNLAMKYGLTHDDLKLKTLIAAGDIASERLYKKKYNEETLGQKSVADFHGYLPYVTAKEVHDKTCEKNYTKDAKEANMHNKFIQWEEELRAKKMALSVKDSAYKKSMWDAIEECKGFMRMDAALHPVVQRGIHVAELISNALYTEEWELEKDLIYFPVQVTPGYETAISAQKFQSNLLYTQQHEETKAKNQFDQTQTERYKDIQTHEKARCDKTYKADYEATKHVHKGVAVTMDMERVKVQKDISDVNYKVEAKKLAMKYGLTADDCKLANCMAVAAATSDRLYKKHYNENVLGLSSKAAVDGHPVYKDSADLKKKLGRNYTKDAMKILEKNNYAQFEEEVRARTVALFCNPDEYSKQRRECINDFKGYMRMDAGSHPIVTRGIEVAEMQSMALYREDYEIEKDLIYFPAQVTPGYEAAQNAYKYSSELKYREKYNEDKYGERPNVFNQVQTEKYQADKANEKSRSDYHYTKQYNVDKESGKGGGKSVAVTMEMERIKAMEKIAVNEYKKEAKTLAMKYGLDAQDMSMQNLIGVQKLRSDLNYKKKYNSEMLGLKSVADLDGYPHLKESNKLQKAMTLSEYSKGARENLKKNNYAKFEEQDRAEKMAYSVRGSNYQRQMKETIEKYKGFQRMDAATHPIVLEGERVNNIISHQQYVEDYLLDRNLIYYPVHMTPGYEAAMFADKWQSNIPYTADYHENKHRNKFNMTETERYKEIHTHEKYRSDNSYKAKQMEEFSKGKGFSSIEETPEMVISKVLRPLRTQYQKDAKELASKYGLVAGAMEIAHAIEMSEVTNSNLYRKKWQTEVQGTSAKNPAIAHPLYDLYKQNQMNLNEDNYKKDLNKMHTFIAVESDETKRARKVALECTPREYTKQRAEVIEKYKGFQRMDAASHPIVTEGERVNNLISKAKYLEDYLLDRESVFYPVHLTEGYDVAIKSTLFQSQKNYVQDYEAIKHKHTFNSIETEKYNDDKKTNTFRSDWHYQKDVKNMFSEGKGFTEIEDRFDVRLSKSLVNTRGERYAKEAKEICGKYGLAHDAMSVTSAIAVGDLVSQRLYKKKWETDVQGKGATNPAIAHPEYLHYKDVQSTLNETNYKAAYEKTQHTYTAVESDEVVRARKVALQCTDREYTKQRAEVINAYKGFQRMDAHQHPIVMEGERVNDIISHSKYIEDYLIERNYVYFPAHITPVYDTAVAVGKFQSDIPYKKDYRENCYKNVFNTVDTEKYKNAKEFNAKYSEKAYSDKWHSEGKLKFKSIKDTPVMQQALQNTMNVKSNSYDVQAKQILSKYGLEYQNLGLQHCIEVAKHHKDYLYKDKYNKETKGTGANYKSIDDVCDYARAKVNQANLNDDKYRETGEKFNHTFTPVYDTPTQLLALQNQKNINHNLYSQSRRDAVEKFKGFQRMDAATHPIVIEGERVNEIISHQKYIEDYLIDRNVIYYPVHLTPGYETAMYANKWQSNLKYQESHHQNKWKHDFNATTTEKYNEDKARIAKISDNVYGKEWKDKLHNSKQHTQIADPTEVKLSAAIRPWIGGTAYTKAAKDIAAKHGLVAGDMSLRHAAESQLQLSLKDYRDAWTKTVRGTGGNYKSIDDMFMEKQAKVNQIQLSNKIYKAKDEPNLHKYTPVVDTPDMRRVKAQAGLLNEVAYSKSRRDCIDKFKGFQNMDAHQHPIVVHGTEANDRISNAKYTEEWNEMKEMIYFPVQITPGYESAMQAYSHQSQILYNKEYHRTKHNNVFNHCMTENYKDIQKNEKARSDYYYKKDYTEKRGKGFSEVETLVQKTAKDVQKGLSMKDYTAAAKQISGKYHIDCNAMQIVHAITAAKTASDKVYLEAYNKETLGAPSKYFHQTETYDVYKKNANNMNPNAYKAENEKNVHTYHFDDKSVAMDHAKQVIKFCSQADYSKTQREVNKTFKAYSKLTLQDDMAAVRSVENSKNISQWRYIEDYLEERQYAFFPVHITPAYETAIKHTEFQSEIRYRKDYEEGKKKGSQFKPTDTEFYQFNKDLKKILPAYKYAEKYEKDKAKGYKGGQMVEQETMKDAQSKLSLWKYRAEAKKVMGKFNIDMTKVKDLPSISLAKDNQLNQSESLYRKDGKMINTKYTSAGKDEFILKMHGDNKINMHPKKYKEDYEKTQHTYKIDVESVNNVLVREAAKIASDREYKKGYAAAVKNSSAYKAIDMWPEDRFHMECTKMQSEAVYKEDYLIDRECCFYPVHITPGYELALEVNRFQSDWLYKQKYSKDTKGKPNQFRHTETELYGQGKKLDEIRNDDKYRKEGRASNAKWQFTVITPVNEHHKQMKELNHPRAYNDEAKQIMMKYDLPVTRVDMEQHREAKNIVSDYIYHKQYRNEVGKSHLWNADKALEGDRHRENTKNMSLKSYKNASFQDASKIKMPADMFSMKAAKEASAACSNLDYKKSYEQAIKTCRAFTKLGTHDIKEYEHHNYVQKLLSDKHYKEEWYDQQGWCIPEFDTPEYRRLREQYERGDVSDVIYKKKFNKNVKGKGLTVFDGPDFQHAKAMKSEQSKISYEAAFKDKSKWSSHVANFTPMAIEQKLAQDFVSDRNYIDRSEYQGRGASCVTDELSQQLAAQKMESTNAYKKDYEENKHKSDFVKVTDAIDAVGFKEAQKLQSENVYKKKHLEEDIGKPTELAMSVKLNTDRAHQQLASELPYKAKGEVTKHIQTYQNNLYLTPWAEYVSEMKHLMSDIKYKQEWEDEKSAIWVPYWWTVEYEHFKAQTDEKNMIKYQAKAKRDNMAMNLNDPKAPSIVQAKESNELCSNLNYGDKKNGIQKFPSPKVVLDAPEMVSKVEAQKMASDLSYKKDSEIFLHNHSMDPTGYSFMENQYIKEGEAARKDAKMIKADQSYDGKMTTTNLKDDMNIKERTEAQKLASETKYKAEAAAEMHSVNGCQETNTPWMAMANASQEYASDLHYKQDISKMKIFYDGMEDVKEAQRKHEILSDLEYRKEYENVWKGAVLSLPVPFDMNMESQCDRQKVRDERAYKKDALQRHRNYVLVPDTPRMRQLKELYESSDRKYKAAAEAEMHSVNLNITDSYEARELKRINELKDNRAYKAEAIAEMSLNSQIPTMDIQHALASTIVADKQQYGKEGKKIMETNLQAVDTQEMQHHKEVNEVTNERLYKAEAKAEMNLVNCNVISHEMETKQDVQKLTNEKAYKIEAQAEMHQVNMNVPDSYAIKNCSQIQENISEVHYKSSDQFGGITDNEWCFQLPDDMSITNATKVNKYQSDAEYKKTHNANKGKTAYIPADTPEFERLKKLQEQYSDLEYKEAARKGMKELTFTPSLEEATKATELASTVKYAKKAKEMSGSNLQVMDSTTEHQSRINDETLASQLKYKEQFNSEKGNKISMPIDEDVYTSTLDYAQKNVSQARYVQKADTSEFTKLEKTYEQDRLNEHLNYVSDARYKQKLEGKSLDLVPEIEAKLEFQTMASKLEYVKNADQHKNKFSAQETEMFKQLKDLKAVQSDVQYTRKAKQGMDKHKAEGLDNRVDIDHSTNVSKICSENEYKKNKQQSGFTFVPEAPLHEHHKHADNINSELRYKRDGLQGQKGKGILFDESNPFQQTFADAQKFTSGRNYKTAAKELNARGCGSYEDDPTLERVRRAGKILSDREYKKDFERGVKGYGYDLRTTPQMNALKNAEKIKSDIEYKKQYTQSMKGKGAYTMESPQMKAAMAAQALMRGEKLGGIEDVPDAIAANDKWVAARVNAILDTPEMRRIKEAKKNSMVNYKDIDYSRGGKIVLDTPEMERIKKASKIQSKVHYADNGSRGRSCNVLDTPEMRMVRRNQKNYSKLDYNKDFEQLKGKATQVVDDLNTRRAKKATEIASDLAYKGIKGRVDQNELARNALENQAKQERIRSAGPNVQKGFTAGRRMDRYSADPGSIFELDDPTDTEQGTHRQERPSSRLSAISSQQDQEDSDYELLANWDPNRLQQQTSGSWQNYLTGSYKKAYAPNHVMKYREEDSHHALQHVGYESSFYGSAAPTPAVPHMEQEEEDDQMYITFKALYDYSAADDDEVSFAEGDVIVQAQPVGGGWYFGVVERTGASGMLPGNYVEQIN